MGIVFTGGLFILFVRPLIHSLVQGIGQGALLHVRRRPSDLLPIKAFSSLNDQTNLRWTTFHAVMLFASLMASSKAR